MKSTGSSCFTLPMRFGFWVLKVAGENTKK